MLVGNRKKGKKTKTQKKAIMKELETWEKPNIIENLLKAQELSLKKESETALSLKQKQQMLGLGNISMVDNIRQRVIQIRNAEVSKELAHDIVRMYAESERSKNIFPVNPTMDYIQGKPAYGSCSLAAITNACEAVQYKSMQEFISMIAIQRGMKSEDEVMLY